MTRRSRPTTGLRKPRPPDGLLLVSIFALVGIGLIMVFSASSYTAQVWFGDSFYFLRRQAVWVFFSTLLLVVTQYVHYGIYRRYARVLLVVGMGLLALTLIPGIGVVARGSQRAFALGPIFISPAELIKLCLVIYLAHGFCRVPGKSRQFGQGVLPYLVIIVAIAAMVMLQPDLGTAVMILGVGFLLIFAAGAPLLHLLGLGILSLPVVYSLVIREPYRLRRLVAFLDPWADPLDTGFHSIQSLYALGSGRLFGLGFGASRQKYLYLPEQHTDFIFAVLGEELGLIGAGVVILLFAVLLWRGLDIAARAPDTFGSLLATGITLMIVLQAVINIGVVTSVLPVTGIPLPLISYGGSSLMVSMIALGILLNISRHARVFSKTGD